MATSLEGSYEGLAPFTYPAAKKPLQTWYRVFGSLSESRNTPLIILHGGPGYVHNYLLNHRFLHDTLSVPVIFYDQIGSGLSTHLPETVSTTDFPDFWTVDIFTEQLRQLVAFLGIGERYDVLGHSWGGMLASEFAHTRPSGLRKLVLANSAASKALSTANRMAYRGRLRREMQEVLEKAEREGDWGSEEVGRVMGEFERRHVCGVLVVEEKEDVKASDVAYGEDMTVAIAMGDNDNGNPFKSVGYMASWSMVGKAKRIEVPTLVVNGVDEFASGEAVRPFLEEIKDVKLVTLKGTTHSPHLERKEEYMRVVGEFLTAS